MITSSHFILEQANALAGGERTIRRKDLPLLPGLPAPCLRLRQRCSSADSCSGVIETKCRRQNYRLLDAHITRCAKSGPLAADGDPRHFCWLKEYVSVDGDRGADSNLLQRCEVPTV